MGRNSFKKGHIPHNKGKKLQDYISPEAIDKIKKTQFKEGVNTGEEHPTWSGGIQKMTNDCVHVWTGTNQRVRRPRKNYIDVYGPIPKGFVIFHKDGNKDNDHYTNLEAILRAELLKRNQNLNKEK